MGDLYAVLEVPPDATGDAIRTSYTTKIRRARRDGGDATRRLTVAYRVLADPRSRADYDRHRHDGTCFFCGQNLAPGDADTHLEGHLAETTERACEMCGRQPAQTFTFMANAGFLLYRREYRFEGTLCRVCAEGTYRDYQARNLARGPWGILSILATAMYLAANWGTLTSSQLASPTPQDPVVDAGLRGRPVSARPGVWLSLAGLAVLIVAVFAGLLG